SNDLYHGGKGPDRQRWLSSWAGSAIKVNRKSNPDALYARHYALPVIGGIQPDLLLELADDAGRRDGFVERILYSYAETWAAGISSAEVSDQVRQGYLALFNQLYAAQFTEDQPLVLVAEAFERLQAWSESNARQVDMARGVYAGILAKLPTQAARLTLVLHG